ncbi:MAG: type II and III secretion system protein, partial [Idiomarina sp.]|nr:type II and III secretion system protein [Idiomarina sp.]
ELSNIDPAVSVAGVPGILTRRTESVFLSEDGDTMVLSGLLNVDKSNQSDEMPGLGELPGLNRVFGSQQHREQTTELVVMVTAEKMSSADKRRLDKEQKREERNNWFKDESVLQLRELVHENTTSH